MATETATGTMLTIDREPEGGTESRWTIDPKHSMVEFAVRHMRFTTVRGRFKQVEGTIHCPDEADRSRAWVEAEIDAASIDTGDPDRDNHLRSRSSWTWSVIRRLLFVASESIHRTRMSCASSAISPSVAKLGSRTGDRLQRTGYESLGTGGRRVYRDDANQPQGFWPYLERGPGSRGLSRR